MFLNKDTDVIIINGKEQKLSTVLDILSQLSGSQISDFFSNREIKLPRAINMLALRSVLNDQVKVSKQLDLTDEMRYRLLSYPDFSEYQLQNFMSTLSSSTLVTSYIKNLWMLILMNDTALELIESELHYLLLLPQTNQKIDFNAFQIQISEIELDYEGEFDGLTEEQFVITLNKSSTLTEVREIGAKYNLNIPRRLKREELETLICERLEENGQLDEAVKAKLSQMSVLMLQRFAKTNGIKLSVELKKDELVDFVLRAAKKADLPKQKKKVELEKLSENEFEFKEEYVKDIIIPVLKKTSVVEQPIGMNEEHIVELIKRTVSELMSEQVFGITEDKVVEIINTKIVSVPSEGGVSEEQLNDLIQAKLEENLPSVPSKEEIEAMIFANVEKTNGGVATISNEYAGTVSSAEVRKIVEEQISQIQNKEELTLEQVGVIVDEKLKDFNPPIEAISTSEIEKMVLSNLDKVNIPSSNDVDYEMIREVVSTTIRETLNKGTEVPSNSVSIEDEPVVLNPSFVPELQDKYHIEETKGITFKEEPETIEKKKTSDRKQNKTKKKADKKKATKDLKKAISERDLKFKEISNRGVLTEEDGKFITDYYYYIQTVELRKRSKRKKRNRIIGRILLFILLIAVLFYLTYFLYALNPSTPVISNIVEFFDKSLSGFSDMMKKISEPLASLVKPDRP